MPARLRRIVEAVVEGERSPNEIASDLGIPIEKLADLARSDELSDALHGLARLADLRAQMLVSKFRANAAMHLIAIAAAREPTELARKACVDLLKTDMGVFDRKPRDDEAQTDRAPVPSEAEILAALERLGSGGS